MVSGANTLPCLSIVIVHAILCLDIEFGLRAYLSWADIDLDHPCQLWPPLLTVVLPPEGLYAQ